MVWVAAVKGRLAEVIAVMMDAGRTVVMTMVDREVVTVVLMIVGRVPATSVEVIPMVVAEGIETLVIPVTAEVRDPTAQSGRNVHEMVDARAGKSARLGNREMRRSAALRRCVHAVAVQRGSVSTQQSAKSILTSGSTRVQFVKRSSRPCNEPGRSGKTISSYRVKYVTGSMRRCHRHSGRQNCANDCSGPSFP